jgi:hypothetical protein
MIRLSSTYNRAIVTAMLIAVVLHSGQRLSASNAQLNVWQTVNYPRTVIRDGDWSISVVLADMSRADAELIVRAVRRDEFVDRLMPLQKGWRLPDASTIDSIVPWRDEKPEAGVRSYTLTANRRGGVSMQYILDIRDGRVELRMVLLDQPRYTVPTQRVHDGDWFVDLVLYNVEMQDAAAIVRAIRAKELVNPKSRSLETGPTIDAARIGSISFDPSGPFFVVTTSDPPGHISGSFLNVAIREGRVELLSSGIWMQ